MRRDDHIRHGNQPHQHIVLNNAVRTILVEQVALFLVNVQTRSTDPAALEAVNERLRAINAPLEVFTITTPGFIPAMAAASIMCRVSLVSRQWREITSACASRSGSST